MPSLRELWSPENRSKQGRYRSARFVSLGLPICVALLLLRLPHTPFELEFLFIREWITLAVIYGATTLMIFKAGVWALFDSHEGKYRHHSAVCISGFLFSLLGLFCFEYFEENNGEDIVIIGLFSPLIALLWSIVGIFVGSVISLVWSDDTF